MCRGKAQKDQHLSTEAQGLCGNACRGRGLEHSILEGGGKGGRMGNMVGNRLEREAGER